MKNTGSKLGSVLLMVCVLIVLGCTVIPKPIKPAASMSETGQLDSGFLGSLPDRSGIFTSNAVKRYNFLAKDYGSKMVPPIQPGDGVEYYTNGTFRIDAYHRVKFGEMNIFYRESLR
jgi:hypothetical protein